MRFPKVRGATGVLAATALALSLAACSGSSDPDADPKPTPSPSTSPSTTPVKSATLTVGVYGARPEVQAYRQVAQEYAKANPGIDVKVRAWSGQRAMIADVVAGKNVPDLFLASRAELPNLVAKKAVRPVDSYLDARGVALGDTYARQAVKDFTAKLRLQCMPYAADPTVLYYNTDMVDFGKVRSDDAEVPAKGATRWKIDQFATALRVATRPGPKGKRRGGIFVPHTASGLAPWIEAAGGHVFDDTRLPSKMTLSDSQDALERILPILTNPDFAVTKAELHGRTPLQAFRSGKLAMMTGSHGLVPKLRKNPGLNWDVVSMPADHGSATTGDYTGLCMSEKGEQHELAADLLAYLISEKAVGEVTRAGYTVPANQEVAFSKDFLSKTEPPAGAMAFVNAVKSMRAMPSPEAMHELDAAIAPDIRLLFRRGFVTHLEERSDELETITDRIDERSDDVLNPPAALADDDASPSPSESASGSASPSSTP